MGLIDKFRKIFQQKSKAEILSASLSSFMLKMLGFGAGFVFMILMTRGIGGEQGTQAAGVFTIYWVTVNILSILSLQGLDTAMVRFFAELLKRKAFDAAVNMRFRAYSLVAVLSLALAFLVWFLAPVIASTALGKPHVAEYIKLAGVTLPFFALTVLDGAIFRGMKHIKLFVMVNDMCKFITPAILLAIFLYVKPLDVPVMSYAPLSFVFAYIINWVVVFGIMHVKIRDYKHEPSSPDKGYTMQEMIQISFPMLLSASLMYFSNWVDTIVLGVSVSESEIGMYNIAFKLSDIARFTLISVNSIMAPKFSESYNNNDFEGFAKSVRFSSKLIFISTIPIVLLMLALSWQVLSIMLESPNIETNHCLLILMLGRLVSACAGSVGIIMQMTGRQKTMQYILLASFVSNLIIDLALVPTMGIVGAAIGNTVGVVIWNIAGVLYIKKHYHINTFYIPWIRKGALSN